MSAEPGATPLRQMAFSEVSDLMRLDIYIADHCENCQEALRLAELARTAPGVEVRVINLDTTTEAVPARVVATPTYALDGRIVSLGNPRPDELLRMLGQLRQGDSLARYEEQGA